MGSGTRWVARLALAIGVLGSAGARADLMVSVGGTSSAVNRYTDALSLTGFDVFSAPVLDVGLTAEGVAYTLLGTPGGAGAVVGLPGGPISVGTVQAGARLAIAPEGNFAVTGGGASSILLYNAAGLLVGFTAVTGAVQDIAYDSLGNLAFIQSASGGLGSVVLGSGVAITPVDPIQDGARLSVAPDGSVAFTLGGDARIFRYGADGTLLGFISTSAPVLDLAYDRLGNLTTLIGNIGSFGILSNALGIRSTPGPVQAGASVAAQLTTPIPEPSSVVLAGIGLAGLMAVVSRRSRA